MEWFLNPIFSSDAMSLISKGRVMAKNEKNIAQLTIISRVLKTSPCWNLLLEITQ
jgi:hypothetical protein